MDEVGVFKIETPRNSNKYYLFLLKTLRFLVPVSLVSFLLSYASDFSLFFTNNFHLSTSVFPTLPHVLERKYMFLICNVILAFLAKTLRFNTSPPVSDFDHHDSMKSTENSAEPMSESSGIKEVPSEDVWLVEEQEECHRPLNVELEGDEEEVYPVPEYTAVAEDKLESEGRQAAGPSVLIESEDMYSEEEDDIEEIETLAAGVSAAEEGNGLVNLNTEELNKKFEEFIRKMKEELLIEAQQPLVAV